MRRQRRYLIGLAIVVALIGAYAAAGFLAVPYFARSYLQDFVRTHYGRTLSIGAIHFNPFTLNLDVTRAALPDADGKTLLSFGELHLGLQLATLWRLGPSFSEIILTQPYVRAVVRPGGALNLADLEKGFPPTPAQPQKKSAPMRLYIGRLAVISGTAVFEDHTKATPFRADFTPIAFELRDFSTTGATGNDYGLSAASPEGERLLWSGTVHLAPLSSLGTFEVVDLKARTLWSYMRQSLPFEIDSGTIGIKGSYDLSGGSGPLGLTVDVRNVAVKGLGLKPKGGAQDYAHVGDIEVNDTRVDFAKHSVKIAKLALSGGDIKAWISEQGALNLRELTGGGAAPSSPQAAPAEEGSAQPPSPSTGSATSSRSSAAAAWSIAAPDISASNFRIAAEDRQVTPAAALLLAPLQLHVAGFNTSPGNTLDITLDSAVNSSGKINARAKVTPGSGALSAHVETENLPLTALQPYIAHYSSVTLLQGTLAAKLDFARQADGALTANATTAIHDLRTVDKALKLDFIKWKDLRVADIRYRSSPASLRIGSITALEPYVRMVIAPDRSLNIKEVLTPPGTRKGADTHQGATGAQQPSATPEAAGAPQSTADQGHSRKRGHERQARVATASAPAGPVTPFPTSIGRVTFVNGSANYADLWIKPSFAIGIQTLAGTVSGLSSDPQSRAKVDLKGKVDRYSPIEIAGSVNLLSAALYTDIRMSFQDLDLTVVNPYSGHFVGYKIAKGKLSVDVSYKIEQRKLTASQHFVIDQLELGERVDSPDAVHVPLKIAVALLKDRNGVIDLNLPMSGSLDDPKFRVGPILWKMFVNLIVKAATAPFALLGHLFGSGNEHMNVIEFAAGSAELQKPDKDQLAAVAKSLQERPQLKLDVPIVYSAALDRPQLAATKLQAELLTREQTTREGRKHPDTAGELALADPRKHFGLLVDQFHADLGKDTPLPPTAVAVQQAKRNEPPPYDPAISDLNAALISHIQVPDSDLEALGKQRAQAIQGALVSEGKIEPGRVFIVNEPSKAESGAQPGPASTAQAQPASGGPPDSGATSMATANGANAAGNASASGAGTAAATATDTATANDAGAPAATGAGPPSADGAAAQSKSEPGGTDKVKVVLAVR